MLKKKYVTASELAVILGVTKSTMYFLLHPEQKEKVAIKKAEKENRPLGKKKFALFKEQHGEVDYIKDDKNVLIAIDDFLKDHKVFDFNFENELKKESFLARMTTEKEKTIDDYSDFITTGELKEITKFNTYQIKKMRESNKVEYITFEDERYPENATGRTQYLYARDSLKEYLLENNVDIRLEKEIIVNISKQFFDAIDVCEFIKGKFNKKTSKLTVYRRITESHEIPAIRVGSMLKIPILEFKNLPLKEIFKIKD